MWLSEINLIPSYSTSQKTQQLKTDSSGKEKNWIKSQSIKSTSCFPSWVLLPWSHRDGQCAVSVWAVLETMIVKHWAFMPGASPRAVSLERWACGPSLEVVRLKEHCLKRERPGKSGKTPDLGTVWNLESHTFSPDFRFTFLKGTVEFWKFCDSLFFYAKN